jgi:hypothetical protein
MTTQSIICARCGFAAGVWTDDWAGAGGPVCVPCEQELCGDVESLPSVLAAVRHLAATRHAPRTADQVEFWAADEWFNREQARRDFADGKKPYKQFAAAVRAAFVRRVMAAK